MSKSLDFKYLWLASRSLIEYVKLTLQLDSGIRIMKSGFLKRLLDRAEKIDKKQIVDFLMEIVQERDLLILIFDSMIEGMIVLDKDRTVEYINQSARTILGLGDGSTTPGLPFGDMLGNPGLLDFCQECMESADPILEREYALSLHDGKQFIQVNMVPLENREERFGSLFLFVDETEHKRREERLREAEKLAALTTLTAGMSHEIRNPLNSMSIHLQLLKRQIEQKGIQDSEMDETLSILSSEIQRLNNVIESFLSSVRPSQPKKRLIDLNSLIVETLTLMEPEFRENNIQVFLHEEGTWPYINADEAQMKQSIINILRNAIEAITSQTDEERGAKDSEVMIQMTRMNDRVTLVFSDTGSGIDPRNLPHIFEAYFTTKPKGTGLGLMTVDRIVREQEGTINVKSELGEGTQIIISLPVAAENPPLIKHEKHTANER